MEVYKIKTSAWECFYILTDLSIQEIESVIEPMVRYERESDELFQNEYYIQKLIKRFPNNVVKFYNHIELIEF